MKKILGVALILIAFVACKNDKALNPEIENVAVEMTIDRFDRLFANVTPEGLPNLKAEYPFLFSKQYDDAFWIAKLSDTLQEELEREVDVAFKDTEQVSQDLERLYKHILYYFPKTTVPKAISIITEVRNKVVLTDDLLLIGLDNYLGEDHYFYEGVQNYKSKNFRKEQIDVDVAHAFAKAKVSRPQTSTFLDQIVYEGKLLFLMETLLSQKPIYEVLSYTADEYAFAEANEVNMWEYFVSNKLLYSTDRKLLSRFIDPAPFSKFYLEFDNDTPGRLGRYIGYKIVTSYMDRNDVALKTMLLQDAETIFNNAKYKP
ncbi:gliding motility lipoprotein GldB [uncultured Dokdonia sp.]|uniref:gliding motility lipoprotein GldB n=1 Tax=uncultured Dokdonia sp. TaxID=575653 RepID=UPI00260FBB6B|nr:gliding motility lipoprotein GldB [uncultured Dokdonia sp.]